MTRALHPLTPSLDEFTDRVAQSLFYCHANEGQAYLPIFSVAGACCHGFRCLCEMLFQIFIGHRHREWRLAQPSH
jgi:hypothetical protein